MGVLITSSLVGCSGLSNCREELSLFEAAKYAYRCEPAAPTVVTKYSRHFERGWQQGYYNVSKGMGTCPPATPPEPYWSIKYKNQDGCRKIAAWYEGFNRGALAAQRDCRDDFSSVPLVGSCQRDDACQCCPEESIRSAPASEVQIEDGYTDTGLSFFDDSSSDDFDPQIVQSSFNAESPMVVRLPDSSSDSDKY